MNSHDRRIARRKLIKTGKPLPIHLKPNSDPSLNGVKRKGPIPLPFQAGQKVRVMTDDYGKSYYRKVGEVNFCSHKTVCVNFPRRKTPLPIDPKHLESA